MKYLSYQTADGQSRFGLTDGSGVFDLSGSAASLIAFLMLPASVARAARDAAMARGASQAFDGTRFLPVIPDPGKVVCLGLNYADHAREGGFSVPDYPALFLRVRTSLAAHNEPLIRPLASDKLDYEAELAVVIGKPGRHLTPANAFDHIAGYTIFNDASVRDYQRRTAQWTPGKNFDATGPLGPLLVTPDELPPGGAGLHIESRLNGMVMQSGTTADMIFDVRRTLVILSEIMTLEPGDIIATGTPPGVGHARKPPVFMRDGDVCEIEIEGIGILRNAIRDEQRVLEAAP